MTDKPLKQHPLHAEHNPYEWWGYWAQLDRIIVENRTGEADETTHTPSMMVPKGARGLQARSSSHWGFANLGEADENVLKVYDLN